ncbi:hypothetical protein BASA81_004829 [Batrachochytrium salamandrivorans]|nr:hypothetical protein BASA81_004829 [Batrachochytrium salamandrivorans]
MEMATSAFCVHGTRQGELCVCDPGWENDLLLLRVNHCNTPQGYGYVVDWLTIAVSVLGLIVSIVWLVHGHSRKRNWKATWGMWFGLTGSLCGVGMGAAHLGTGGPGWLFWLFMSLLVACTFGAVNLVNDLFFDVLRRDLGKRKDFTLKSTRIRQGALIVGFVVTFFLYFSLSITLAITGDNPASSNIAVGVVFLLQPVCNVFSVSLFWTLSELLALLGTSDSDSELIRTSRLRIGRFRNILVGLWAWLVFVIMMVSSPLVGVGSVYAAFPIKFQAASASSSVGEGGLKSPQSSKLASKVDVLDVPGSAAAHLGSTADV